VGVTTNSLAMAVAQCISITVHKPQGAAAVVTACHAQLQQLRCLKPLVQCHKGSIVVHNGLSQRIPGAVTA